MAFNSDFSEAEALKALQGNTYYTINAISAQTQVKASPGFLHGVLFMSNNVSAVAIYDNTISGGTTLASFPVSAMTAGPWFNFDVNFKTGLVVSSGSANTIMMLSYQ